MKKLISIVLTLTLVLCLCVATTLNTGAANADIATTSARTFSVSEEAGASFDEVDGYVYGYVGDADNDDSVSVMDATAIQLHCAETQVMIAVLAKMADVDMDNSTTVMDATAIQLHLASIKESEYINHVLYTPYDNFDQTVDTFDEIAKIVEEKGSYDEDLGTYYMDMYEEEGNDNVYYTLDYFPEYDTLSVYTSTYVYESNSYIDTSFRIVRGDKTFKLCSSMYDDYDTYFSATCTGNVVDIDVEAPSIFIELEYEEFSSDYGITVESIDESLKSMSSISLAVIENFVVYDLVGSVIDLVYDVQSLM